MLSFKTLYREMPRTLQRTAAVFVGVAVLIGAAAWFNQSMRTAQNEAAEMLRSTAFEYRNAIEAERILKTQATRFDLLRAEGFIGPEPRLRWIEDVREIASRSGLVAIKYQLGARESHPTSLPTATYQLYASPMKLELHLRHEGDLLTFLDMLEGRRGGLFELASCSLARVNDGTTSLVEANVKASCNLLWYSLDEPSADTEEFF